MNLANYPNKAASWLNGKVLGELKVLQVYRDNNTRSPQYVCLVKSSHSNEVRVCSYPLLGKAFHAADLNRARGAFSGGRVVSQAGYPNYGAGAAAAAGVPVNRTPTFNTNVSDAALVGAGGGAVEDNTLAMMTALVRAGRENPRIANIVKTMSQLV